MGAAAVVAPGADTKAKSSISSKKSTVTTTTEDPKDAAPAPADPSDNSKALAPPPRPDAAAGNTTDYFNGVSGAGGSLSLEPNPFEQSFGGGAPETPGGTKLPSVAALTSPASLLPGANGTPFWPGGSLRTGPLSPAMLSGPTGDYFSDAHHIRGGFPTPNESSLRTGLTPGGSGSMFPAPSPGGAAFLNQLASGGVTPSTIDFHRTAISAAAAKRDAPGAAASSAAQPATSQPGELVNGTLQTDTKGTAGQYDPHDSDAANGLFMLAQGRNAVQPPPTYAVPQLPNTSVPPVAPPSNASPEMSNRSVNGTVSGRDMSEASEENEKRKPNTRAKGKKAAAGTRRKAEETTVKAPPQKKARSTAASSASAATAAAAGDDSGSDDDDDDKEEDGPKGKMTEEDKRKNFLERNRVAALKCRQRKKQWLANLQHKVEVFSSENDALNNQVNALREEVVSLKTLLMAHKDCPVTQQQGLHTFIPQHGTMDQYNAQINPYQMAAPIPSQQVIAGQAVNRRFS